MPSGGVFLDICMLCSFRFSALNIPWDLLILLDDSILQLHAHQKRTLSAAKTAAEKTILKLWIEPLPPKLKPGYLTSDIQKLR